MDRDKWFSFRSPLERNFTSKIPKNMNRIKDIHLTLKLDSWLEKILE